MDSNTEQSAPDYDIRPLADKDGAKLHHIMWQHRPLERLQAHIERMLYSMNKKRALCIVVEDHSSKQLLAYGQILRMGRCYEISDLIVDEQWRSQGIGSAMIHYLINEVEALSDLPIEIGVTSENGRALALYQRLGFEKRYQRVLEMSDKVGGEPVFYLVWQRKNALK